MSTKWQFGQKGSVHLTDKEFKRLGRAELIDIIYQLQIKQEALISENAKLKEELADKRIRLRQAGNIAEASLEIHNVMQSAQNAASQYLEEIRIMRDETEKKCRKILEKAQKEADAMVARAGKTSSPYDAEFEAIMKEYAQKTESTGDRK